jgi:uncharacterized protein YndB with AHSA1/START domain
MEGSQIVSDSEAPTGRLARRPGHLEAVIERLFDVPPARVWSALIDSAQICLWLAPGEIAHRVGGPAKLSFEDSGIKIDSVVTAFVPGALVEYSWSGKGEPPRPLCWQVEPTPGGTRLRLTMRIPDNEDGPRAAAGFEAHLDMLAAALEGVPIKFPFARFKTLREAYKAQLAG